MLVTDPCVRARAGASAPGSCAHASQDMHNQSIQQILPATVPRRRRRGQRRWQMHRFVGRPLFASRLASSSLWRTSSRAPAVIHMLASSRAGDGQAVQVPSGAGRHFLSCATRCRAAYACKSSSQPVQFKRELRVSEFIFCGHGCVDVHAPANFRCPGPSPAAGWGERSPASPFGGPPPTRCQQWTRACQIAARPFLLCVPLCGLLYRRYLRSECGRSAFRTDVKSHYLGTREKSRVTHSSGLRARGSPVWRYGGRR